MNLVAADIFNLANCARAGIYDTVNMLLIKSFTQQQYQDEMLSYIKRLNLDNLGLTQSFIDNAGVLINSCNTVTTSGKATDEKLKDIKTCYKTFFDGSFPKKVFMTIEQ